MSKEPQSYEDKIKRLEQLQELTVIGAIVSSTVAVLALIFYLCISIYLGHL